MNSFLKNTISLFIVLVVLVFSNQFTLSAQYQSSIGYGELQGYETDIGRVLLEYSILKNKLNALGINEIENYGSILI